MAVSIIYKTVGKWKENSYLLASGGQSWLVDPGDEFEVLDEYFATAETTIQGIINTHAHFDHIGAVDPFKKKYAIPFYVHKKDRQLVGQGNLYRKLAGETTTFVTPSIEGFITECGPFQLNGEAIQVLETPGHSHGSVCFIIEKNLICGDLIFEGGIGRSDLPGGNKALLWESVKMVLKNFEGYMVYPGHGNPFVLDAEAVNRLEKCIADG